jgi:diguanylate cyclase (GGDEF)-like protein
VLAYTARAIIDALREPIGLQSGETTHVGASIGIACFPLHGNDRHRLYGAADAAMYQVKRSGKNSYAVAVPLQEAAPDRPASPAAAQDAAATPSGVLQ